MNKLFTFGCSFTKYRWSTWADIVSDSFLKYENLGHGGAGNTYIFNKIMQTIASGEISNKDTVIVMWSSVDRDDRFFNDMWHLPGSIYNQDIYGEEFMRTVDPEGFFIRDCANIAGAYHALESIGCTFKFLSMTSVWTGSKKYKRLYKKYLEYIRPSTHKILFNSDWNSRNHDLVGNTSGYSTIAGDNWPTIENWCSGNINLSDDILLEILDKLGARSIQDIINNKLWCIRDIHPTPIMHLEYVQKVLPEYPISSKTIWKIENENKLLFQ